MRRPTSASRGSRASCTARRGGCECFVLATAKIPERAIVDLVMLPREEVVKLLEEGLPMIRG